MKGSKTVQERLFILKNVDKIIFVSQWVKDRFFEDLDQNLVHKTELFIQVYQYTKILKKDKIFLLLEDLMTQKVMIFLKNL